MQIEVLPLLQVVIFPATVTPLAIGRPESIALVDRAIDERRPLGMLTLRDPAARPAHPAGSDLYAVGTLAAVHRMVRLHDGSLRVAVEGIERFAADSFEHRDGALWADIRAIAAPQFTLADSAQLDTLIASSAWLSAEQRAGLRQVSDDAARLMQLCAALPPRTPTSARQHLLECTDAATILSQIAAIG